MRYKRVNNAPNQEWEIKLYTTVVDKSFDIGKKNGGKYYSSEYGSLISYYYEDIPTYADGLYKGIIKKALQLGWIEDTKPSILKRIGNWFKGE